MGFDDYVMQLAVEAKTDFKVHSFSIQEELSSPFLIGLNVFCQDKDVDLETIVGRPASFALRSGLANAQAPARVWTGVCSHVEMLLAENTGLSSYFIQVVPDLWLLTQRRNHRVFQRLSLVDIVLELFDEWKLPKPTLSLKKEYDKLDFVVQYGETDFNFVSRLLERAGVTYRFDFDGDRKKTKIVFDDQPQAGMVREPTTNKWETNHRDLAIPFQDTPNEASEREFVTNVRVSRQITPGKFTVREWDWRRQSGFSFLESSVPPEDDPELFYEHYEYRPVESRRVSADKNDGNTPTADDKGPVRQEPKRTKAFATVAVDALRQTYRRVTFKTNCVDLAPGTVFAIQGHPRRELDASQKLLVHKFTLEGVRDEAFTYQAEALVVEHSYNPQMRTPRPTIQGLQSAVVVGKHSEIDPDEFGRVRVRFHWDRKAKFDENASCWVRVSQTWSGAGFGSVLTPRVGQEVLVAFVEGDPDHPLIVGRVFNNDHRTPYSLPDHRTRSTWRSDSSVKSDGFNEITFEDEPEKELVYIQAQHDMQKLTKRAETERTFNNRTRIVGEDRSAIVKTVDATMVGDTWTTQVISPPSKSDLKILEQGEPTVSPTETVVEMKDKRVIFTTGQASVVFDDDKIVFDASGDIKVKADKGDVIIEGKKAYLNSKPGLSADKPDALVDVEPSTFVPSATDKTQVLVNKVKTEQYRSTLDTGLVPKQDNRDKEKIEQIPCKLTNEDISCQHGRHPCAIPRHKDENVLEVVAPGEASGDTITCKATLVGGCGNHIEWKVGGFWQTTKKANTIDFNARGWTQGAPGDWAWQGHVLPHLYTVYGYACDGHTKPYKIKCYPNDLLVFTWAPLEIGWVKVVNKIMTDWVQQFLSSEYVTLELAKGPGIAVKAQWKEWTDWRCWYRYEIDVQLSPLIKLEFKFPLGPRTPPFVEKYVKAGFYIRLWGEIGVQARWRKTSPDGFNAFGDAVGYVGAAVGGEIAIANGKILAIKAEGEGKFEAIFTPDHTSQDDPKYKFQLNFMGLRAIFVFSTWNGKFSRSKTTTIVGPKNLLPGNPRAILER